MIDAAARAEVRRAVEDYFFDRSTAFQFDQRLFSIRTRDQTARFVIAQLWFFYDDCRDHLVHADKADWDAVQRLLLLLDSNAELSKTTTMHWHGSQCVAVISLLAIAVTWPMWPIPFFIGGVISLALSNWRRRARESLTGSDPWRCWPFPSFAALERAWDSAPYFQKQRYRRELAVRPIRPSHAERGLRLEYLLTRLVCSPAVLLAQSLPLRADATLVDRFSASGRS